MFHRYRRGLAIAVTAVSLLVPAAIPAPAPAGEGVAAAAAGVLQNKVSLEEAIKIGRNIYPDTAKFEQFTSDYTEYKGRGVWHLRWSNSREPGGQCMITVSAASGEVLNIDIYRGCRSGRFDGLPAYTRTEALEKAKQVAKQLVPDKFTQCIPAPQDPMENARVFPLRNRTYPVMYNYVFLRTVNGIPVNGNTITVGINAETGEMQNFNLSWEENLNLPDPAGRLSPDHTAAIFTETGLELTYMYFGPRDRDTDVEPRLVYQLRDGRFLLDALTGKRHDSLNGPYYFDVTGDFFGGGGGEPMTARAQKMPLTVVEQEAVDKLGKLLTADQARMKAEAAYSLPPEMQLTSKELMANWSVPGSKIWSFNYTDKEKRLSLNVSVDARNGELLGFARYDNEPDYRNAPEVKLSQAQAQEIAQNFIKKQQPSRAGQVVLRRSEKELGPWSKAGDERPRSYVFEFARMVNGIPYPENGFSVTVSSVTGEITNYQMRWWDTTFPAAAGVISQAAASARFLEKHPLMLEYARAYAKWPAEQTDRAAYFLLYHPTNLWPAAMLDANTGQEIDYEGKPVADRRPAFTDITGHPAAKDIDLLAEQGIVTAKDGRFRPNDVITGKELLEMLARAAGESGGYQPLNEEDDQQLLDRVLSLRIIEDAAGFDPARQVTRIQAARWLVNSQGFGPLARHGEAFKLAVKDAGLINPADRGYAAAALAMGYLTPQDGGTLAPNRPVTRGEAAGMLVRALLAH
ncbi:MAG: YcdB/YcdC domain-containing protein [Bacillota bacterium]|uniref:YcdB/YcdC domain-containing protein n=1 Tax=Desulforudis sp. DRI-14 TaxID=3459793 RepID=UPI003478850D